MQYIIINWRLSSLPYNYEHNNIEAFKILWSFLEFVYMHNEKKSSSTHLWYYIYIIIYRYLRIVLKNLEKKLQQLNPCFKNV